jgi:RHS repeat-associated protein
VKGISRAQAAREEQEHERCAGLESLFAALNGSGMPAQVRLCSVGKPGSWAVSRYAYDGAGNLVEQLDANQSVKPLAQQQPVRFEYDKLNRRVKRTLPEGQFETMGYDAAGNVIAHTNFAWHASPSGVNRHITQYQYDALNRLTNVYHGSVAGPIPAGTAYGYDAVSNLKSVKLPNAIETTYDYDVLNRLTLVNTVKGTGPGATEARASFDYATAGLSGTGKRLGVDETINAATRTVRYAYDPRYRLTQEKLGTGTAPSVDYTHDKVGNRQGRSSSVSGVPAHPVYQYNGNDWLTGYGAESLTSTFDPNGNTLRGEVTPAQSADDEYDHENRLVKRTVSGKTIVLRYDGDGNRVGKEVTESGVTTTTTYLIEDRNPTGYAQVWREVTTGGLNTTRDCVYGLDLIRIRVDFGAPKYYGYDGHGSVRFLTDSSGDITDTYTYDVFGLLLSSSGMTPNPYRYAGEYYDADLELYYLRARWYAPQTGRFWTMDSYEGSQTDPLSLHKYLYAHANPVMMVDPSGRATEGIGGQVVTTGGIGSLASQGVATVSRAYVHILVRLPQVISAGERVLLWADFLGGLAGVAAYLGPEVIDAAANVAERVDQAFTRNTQTISPGWSTRGRQIEAIAGFAIEEGGGKFLGGNVKGIDGQLAVAEGDVLVSIKSHNVATDKLLGAIETDLKKLSEVDTQRLFGTTRTGADYVRSPGPSAGRIAIIAVPENQARHIISPDFVQKMRQLAQQTRTIPIVRAVRGFR